MARKLSDFLAEIEAALKTVFPGVILKSMVVRSTHLNARAEISEETFISIYFSEETQRINYALIQHGDRIYGMDNLKGWHCHPFGDVDQHLPCAEPSAQEVFETMSRCIEEL